MAPMIFGGKIALNTQHEVCDLILARTLLPRVISNPIKTLSVVFVSSWRFPPAYFLDESFLSGEESLPDHGELGLEDLMKTVFESV